MKNDDLRFENIHRYLLGELPEVEKTAFEKALADDPKLRADLEKERLLIEGIEQTGDRRLRKKIADVSRELRAEGFFDAPTRTIFLHQKRLLNMKNFFAIAAALAAVVAAVWFFFPKKMTAAEAFARANRPPLELMKTRSAELAASGFAGLADGADTLKMAIDLQTDGKYDESVRILNAFLAAHPGHDEASFWLGIAHLNRERYARALEIFMPITRLEGSKFRANAIWHGGLCFLKTEGGETEAIALFRKLDSDPEFGKMSRQMIDWLAAK